MADGGEISVELVSSQAAGSLGPPETAGVRIGWDPAAITGGEARPWRIEGELDWGAVDSLRILSASLEDGTVLAVAALRPRGAAGHSDDLVGAAMRGPEGEAIAVAETLLSTEYGPDGAPRRIGLELWGDEQAVPIRVAADAEADRSSSLREADGGDIVPVTVRSEGRQGTGLLHLLREG